MGLPRVEKANPYPYPSIPYPKPTEVFRPLTITSSDWGGSRTDSGSRDGAVHNPPEVLTLQPELHLVNPNVIVGPIKDGDGGFDIIGGGGRHVSCWVSKKETHQLEIFP